MPDHNANLQAAIQSVHDLPMVHIYFESKSIVPGNVVVTPHDRCFFSINPLANPEIKFYEMIDSVTAIPYPNEEYAIGADAPIGGVLGVRLDQQNNLWLLDMVKHQFLVWNIEHNRLDKIYPIAPEVYLPNSFLQDFIIDHKHQRIIIADMTLDTEQHKAAPAFVVFNLGTGTMFRYLENHYSIVPDAPGNFGLNPIAIDPDCEWVYFGAVHSHKLYRAPAESFADEATLKNSVEAFSDKSFCDGIAADQYGNVYITNVEANAIGVANKHGFKNIAQLPQNQVWPDGLCLAHDQMLYCTISQVSRLPALNDGQNLMQPPFLIVNFPVDGAFLQQ